MQIPLITHNRTGEKTSPRASVFHSAAGRLVIFASMALLLAFGLTSCAAGAKEAGLGQPLSSAGWEVTVNRARVETSLGDSFTGVFTPDQAGAVFFVIDYGILNKGGTGQFALYATATSEGGETYHPRIMSLVGSVYGILEEGKAFKIEPGMAKGSEHLGSLGFVIPAADAGQAYRIEFLDLPGVSFLVKAAP